MDSVVPKKTSQLLKKTGVVGGLTLVSRMLGFVRDAFIAWLLGVGPGSDAFFLAFRIPDLLRKFFSDGMLTLSFVPVFTTCLIEDGPKRAFAMARACFLSVSTAGVLLVVAGIVAAPMVVRVIAPGFSPDSYTYDLAVQLIRVMMPYIAIVALLAVSMGVLNAMGEFAAPGAGPIVFNLSIILSAFFLCSRFSSATLALALGVVLGGLFQFLLQVPFLLKKGFKFFERTAFHHPGMSETGRRLLPSLVGAAGFQINLFVATILASTLSSGSISFLYYAERLVQFPMALFAVSISTVLLPELSMEKVQGPAAVVSGVFARAVKAVCCVTLPAMFGLAALRVPVVSLLFERGAFDRLCVEETASALLFFILGLWAFSGNRIFVTLFHARSDVATPFWASVKGIGFNLLAGLLFGQVLGYRGIALSVSAAAALNFFFLVPGVWSSMDRLMKKNIGIWTCKSLFASVIMYGSVTYGVSFIPDGISKAALLVRVAGMLILGVVVYTGTFVLTFKKGLGQLAQELDNRAD
ncbi:MviN [Desulforapulum autotrophicum HRM2]|uniref:Probable lipid II flippase MurJ n=1 Tax=Desulforapulum autotrophicum (strain ATCC 43914 / DSM 3382 / VKM B-1955 / HRM2) TaxID=177437 RepID=C0QI72_DESAH|nr:murein biosynthesis integral membrane protein MurJ [Desulforapulum autotrophicum]ACN15808.1 MviN [Desulforapulum autotrophicum HRM2]